MKKLIMLIMAICLIAPAAMADLSKAETKQVEKLAKKRCKELQKEGWKVMGALPLESALQKHFAMTAVGDVRSMEQTGIGRAKSKNNGRQMCINSAMTEYASKCMSQLSGRTVADSFGNQIALENNEEFDRFYAAYERITQGEIKGELQESYTIYKENPDGSCDFQMMFVVDVDRASAARQRALANAAKESGLAQEFADQIAKFIQEPLAD